jgi:hypothetical protein
MWYDMADCGEELPRLQRDALKKSSTKTTAAHSAKIEGNDGAR